MTAIPTILLHFGAMMMTFMVFSGLRVAFEIFKTRNHPQRVAIRSALRGRLLELFGCAFFLGLVLLAVWCIFENNIK